MPVVTVGRIAGQYAKPRSSATELVKDLVLPSFRGHIVHSDAPDPSARRPDPGRLVEAWSRSLHAAELLRRAHPNVWVSHEALLLD